MRWLLCFHTDSYGCMSTCFHYWDIKDVTIHVSINAHFMLEDIIVFLVLFVLNLFVYITSC